MNNSNRRLFQTRENFTFRDKKIFSLIPNLNEAGIKENLAENPRFLHNYPEFERVQLLLQ